MAVVTSEPSALRTDTVFPVKATMEGFLPNSEESRSMIVRWRRPRSTKITEGKRYVENRESWMIWLKKEKKL